MALTANDSRGFIHGPDGGLVLQWEGSEPMAEEATETPAGGGEQQKGPEATAATKTFSQEDLDRIVKDRLERQSRNFKDYDDLKQKAARLDELEESRKTEAEKLLGAVERYKSEAQQAAERERAAQERASNTLVRAAVVSEASRQKAIDPDAVYALLDKSKLTIGDDDQVAGVEDAVAALLSERSYLVGRPPGGFDGGARHTAEPVSSRAALNDAIRKQAGFGG